MAYVVPTVTDFKEWFVRDFPYGVTENEVMDIDITKAIAEAGFNFNEGLYASQAKFTMAYLYLTAHYLVMDLRASSQGIAGKYTWLQTSKSVGSVSESFQVPQSILDNPTYSMLSQTYYGMKYLSLIISKLVGQVFVVGGATLP